MDNYSENDNNYSLDEELINDIECKHNNKKKPYIKYCLSCGKNFCNWCKGHENHNIIDFDSIEPNQEKFEEIEQNLLNMKSISEIIKNKYNEIIEAKNYLNELNIILNDTLEKLEELNKNFENHLKFNETIFDYYKDDKRNYYIINNFNSLNCNEENDFLNKDINMKKIDNVMNSIKKVNDSESNNMWISEKYCKGWGLKEGIREFIQNQYDGIITKIKSKKNLKVQKIGKQYLINEKIKYLNYDFYKKDEDKIFGKIRYDEESKILSISNEGELCLADFLLGGSKGEQNNSDIIGVFGEGMKLAILALCRLEKIVTIISSQKLYSFDIKEDSNFTKNSQPQKCLHCKIEKYDNDDMIDQIKVLIYNINIEEWSNQTNNFLWLLEDDIEIYKSVDSNNNEVGQIIYENDFKNKIYVKGIFVQEIKSNIDKNLIKDIPGFNANLKLDRDRNCVQSSSELQNFVSKIMAYTFNKNIDYLKDFQQKTGNAFIKTDFGFEKSDEKGIINFDSQLKYLVQNIINLLKNYDLDIINYYSLSNYLSKESVDVIWNEMNLVPENNNKQPTSSPNSIIEFIEEKKLPKEFYPYYQVNYKLEHVLEKSSFYKGIETKFTEYIENSPNAEPSEEYKIALKDIYSKIQLNLPDFNENNVHFKIFEKMDKNFCFKNNVQIYFSSIKLEEEINDEWKFWIFIKILNISNIKIEDSFDLFNKIFKENIPNQSINNIFDSYLNV